MSHFKWTTSDSNHFAWGNSESGLLDWLTILIDLREAVNGTYSIEIMDSECNYITAPKILYNSYLDKARKEALLYLRDFLKGATQQVIQDIEEID